MSSQIKPSEPATLSERVLCLQLPTLSDAAALGISDLLAAISEKFDDLYARQIQRASRARRREELKRRREKQPIASQQELPIS
jgi:hypothetical protein